MSDAQQMEDTPVLTRRRRRERPMLVCLECHRRKLKCNKQRPCDRCSKNNPPLKCTYVRPVHGSAPKRSPREQQQRQQASTDRERGPDVRHTPGHSDDQADARPESILPAVNRSASASESRDRSVRDDDADSPTPGAQEGLLDGNADALGMSENAGAPTVKPSKLNSRRTWYGRSSNHWLFPKFQHIMALMGRAGFSLPGGQFTTFNELKTSLYQRRTLFLGETQGPQLSMFEEFPPRSTTEFLVQRYFDTFGSVFALLQKPIFQDQVLRFWEKPESVPISDCIQILLVIAIGNGTLDINSGRLPDTKIEGWWHLILAWQGVALRSNPCDVSTLQACCLIDIMRQVYSLDSTATWSSSGMLTRNAMVAGLHRDPSVTGDRLTKDELETQQNLWYTILELDLQSSMNEGVLTTIGPDDWDMSLPTPPRSGGSVAGGDSSPVGYLILTLRTRMRIANFLNDIRCSTKYDEASKLQETFEAAAHPLLADSSPDRGKFALCFSAILCQRSLLALHLPFGIQRSSTLAFSHTLCVSTAISILETIDPPNKLAKAYDVGGLVNMMRTSGSLFRTVALQAVLFLCFQLEVSITDNKPWTLIAELRDRIIDIIDRYALIAERRLATQDFVGKAFIIANMVSAKAKLVRMGHSGAEIDAASPAMAKDIAEVCFAIFRNRPDIPGPVPEDMTPIYPGD
ncbi:fungal specific transcription factor [Colletotrichum tamarilloi]|uniref:Fungal specific transcription factor n=1 Tax=Colletotrichum tamarilloi TaxID=1209934 RepID=A0ABQ9QLF4_9PEZI|nr:fungal specific transcription factor [Colletotrichum tamarilloi]KAK1476603.1 fungal specific transcription factor [Colletotrichum tamarilloi]